MMDISDFLMSILLSILLSIFILFIVTFNNLFPIPIIPIELWIWLVVTMRIFIKAQIILKFLMPIKLLLIKVSLIDRHFNCFLLVNILIKLSILSVEVFLPVLNENTFFVPVFLAVSVLLLSVLIV